MLYWLSWQSLLFILMVELNLPSFEYKIKQHQGKAVIFDVLRKKNIVLTPEEWVRQHFVHYIINHLGYSKSLIKIESGLKYNTITKRSDLIAYNQDGEPVLLVECKAPHIKLTDSVIRQVASYNKIIDASYIVMTNGLEHICMVYNKESNQIEYLDNIPNFTMVNIKKRSTP